MHPSSHLLPWYQHCSRVLSTRRLPWSLAGDAALRAAARMVLGYGSGPVRSSLEVGAVSVTAPVPAGRSPAPPLGVPIKRRTSNRSKWLQIALFVNPPRSGVSK